MDTKKNQKVSKSAAFESTQRDEHDFTQIMGYKNIDMSRDVDQSYMLKGSQNTSKKTNSSRNAGKNDSSLEKGQISFKSQRGAPAHNSGSRNPSANRNTLSKDNSIINQSLVHGNPSAQNTSISHIPSYYPAALGSSIGCKVSSSSNNESQIQTQTSNQVINSENLLQQRPRTSSVKGKTPHNFTSVTAPSQF